jgi:hypothetical protein
MGPQTDKQLPQSPYAGHFFKTKKFCFAFFGSYCSTELSYLLTGELYIVYRIVLGAIDC